MVKYQQNLKVSDMHTPEQLPDVPVIHSGEPSWGNIAGEALEGFGNVMVQASKVQAQNEEASAKAAERTEGNNYAREMQRLVNTRDQTGNRTQFEQSVRALTDNYLARGVLKADTLASIRNSYDYGYLSMNEKSRERMSQYDDEAQLKVVQEMQSKYSHLKGRKPTEILRNYNKITNDLDFAIELQNRKNSIDPDKYPEEYKRLTDQSHSYFENNVTGQIFQAIASDLHSNTEMFKDPVKVEEYKQSLIAFLTSKKVSLGDASMIVETALTRAGAYTVYDNEKNILGVSKQNMQDVISYRETKADYDIKTNYPELVVASQLVKTMPPEIYKTFSNTAEGVEVNKLIAANFVAASKGATEFNTNFPDKSLGIKAAQNLQRTDAPSLLKGSSIVAAARAINDVPSIATLPKREFDVVVNNARGVVAVFSDPHTQATKRQLLSSNKPNENALGMEMEAAERGAKALVNSGVYLQSATKGAQSFRYIMENSTIGNNLRVNSKGQLVFVPGSSPLAAFGEGIMEQFEGYGNMIADINQDAAATTGLSGQELVDFWKSAGIPELGEGERPQFGPAFNWTSDKSLAEVRAEREEALEGNDKRYEVLDKTIKTLSKKGVASEDAEFVNKLKKLKRAAYWSDGEGVLKAYKEVASDPTFDLLSDQAKAAIGGSLYTDHSISSAEMSEIDEAVAAGKAIEGTQANPDIVRLEEAKAKGLKPHIERAVDGTISAVRASATTKSSTTLANAKLSTDDLSIWEDVERSSAADTRAAQGLSEYDTELGAAGEANYQEWKKTLPKQLQSEQDYDLRGYYKDSKGGDAEGHLTDKYKKPNHPTFSTESKYYKKGMWAGKWNKNGDFEIPEDTPAEKLHELMNYWATGAEKGHKIIMGELEISL
jgi:hypothetical protein